MANLADLKIGEKGEIVGFTDELLSLKLLEMGCLPGTEVVLITTKGEAVAVAVAVVGCHYIMFIGFGL